MLCALAFDKNTYKYFILLGVGCGILTDVRIMGVLLIVCISLFFISDYLTSLKDKKRRRQILKLFFTYITSTALVIYVAWPYLWRNPIQNFRNSFITMSKFPWDGGVLFDGQYMTASHLPWNYGIIWFLISNPTLYLVLGIIGIIFFIYNSFRNYKNLLLDEIERNNLLYFFCFIMPIIAVIDLHSVIYDTWRQLYFIYPAFILLAIYGLNRLIKTKAKLIAVAIPIIVIGLTAFYMVNNYPFEHIYFNEFVRSDEPEHIRKNWEFDYWGTSYKQALDYIVKNDTSQKIDVGVADWPGIFNSMLLKPIDRKRINYIENMQDVKYYITNYRKFSYYREHPDSCPLPQSKTYYSFKVLNSTVVTVFKLK